MVCLILFGASTHSHAETALAGEACETYLLEGWLKKSLDLLNAKSESETQRLARLAWFEEAVLKGDVLSNKDVTRKKIADDFYRIMRIGLGRNGKPTDGYGHLTKHQVAQKIEALKALRANDGKELLSLENIRDGLKLGIWGYLDDKIVLRWLETTVLLEDRSIYEQSLLVGPGHVSTREWLVRYLPPSGRAALLRYKRETSPNYDLRRFPFFGGLFCDDCESLSQALKIIPPYIGIVYRGVTRSSLRQVKKFLKKGSVVSERAFLSASRAEDYARTFVDAGLVGIHFIINSKTGRAIENLPMDSLQWAYEQEREVVFLPDTKFEIKEVIKNSDGTYTVYMDEL